MADEAGTGVPAAEAAKIADAAVPNPLEERLAKLEAQLETERATASTER